MPVAEVLGFVVGTCVLVGLAVGSFLNVVVYRVPAGRSVVSPGSACPSCGTGLAVRDNIPILSWLLLRGRCRTCEAAISVRYPVIEALTAALFALTALRFGASWSLPAELALVGGLVALAAVDLDRYLLPRAIVYPTAVLVLLALVAAAGARGQWSRLGVALGCAASTFVIFYAIHMARPRWMGFGDVRLAALLGLGLGWLGPWYVVIALIAANLLGTVLGVALMLAGKATRTTRLPYGVFLAAGSILAILAGAQIIGWYSHHVIA